jgi:hypothetical protein
MYNHIWKKYLPVIRILMKKSVGVGGQQVLDLNKVDFEKAGTARKTGYKFTIHFSEGKISNVISGSSLAMHLATVMQEDEATREILSQNNFSIALNTKFQLIIKNAVTED